MWIDAHAHLYDLDETSLDAQLNACRAAGIDCIINTGTSLESSEKVRGQCLRDPRLFAAVGISPLDAAAQPPLWEERLRKFVRADRVIAVGEIGLDTTNPAYPPLSVQQPVFERQLELAKANNLPVVVHSRGCESQTVKICAQSGVIKAVFHCFTGDINALKAVLDRGYYVSFSGIITFKNASLNACVAYAPLNRLFIETDSPYLAPQPHRGKPNQPAWVTLVGKEVARIKKKEEAVVAQAIHRNFRTLFFGRS